MISAILLMSVLAAPDSKPAPANPGRGVVVLLDSAPGFSQEQRDQLLTGLQQEVGQSQGYTWIEPPGLNVDELALALNCSGMDDSCLRRAAENLKAETVLLVVTTTVPRRELVLSLFAPRGEKSTPVVHVSLAAGGDAVGDARAAARTLLGPLKLTRLVVITQPPGATVTLDGKALAGVTPAVAGEVPPGQHQVSVAAAGYQSQTTQVSLMPGQSAEVTLTLSPNHGTAPASAVAGAGERPDAETAAGSHAAAAQKPAWHKVWSVRCSSLVQVKVLYAVDVGLTQRTWWLAVNEAHFQGGTGFATGRKIG